MSSGNGLRSTAYFRQLDILSPDELTMPITVIGVGGIGSPVALALAKMGCTDITVIDPDTIEEHNLPNQMYMPKHIGMPKVEAMADIIRSYCDLEIKQKREQFTASDDIAGVVISCVDKMDPTRIEIWKALKNKSRVDLYIDTRMGGEVGLVFPVHVTDGDYYETTLHGEDKAAKVPCTAQAIIYNTFMISSAVAALLKKHIKGEDLPLKVILDLKNLDIHKIEAD